MKGRIVVHSRIIALLCIAATTAACGPSARTSSDIVVEMNVAVPMRDGVVLRADIYRPAGDGPRLGIQRCRL